MTAQPIPDSIPPEEARQIARRRGIGGSDVPKILGLTNFGSAIDVWADKLNLRPKEPENELMRWGKALEPELAQAYMERTGKRVVRPPDMMRHPKHSWMLGNIDRLVVGEPKLVELKCAGWAREWGQEGTEAVPDAYYAQVQWYLAVSGFKAADCAVLIGGNKFRIYPIERAERFIAEDLIPVIQEFWEKNVLGGIAPKVDGSEACRNYINQRYRDVREGSALIATAELVRLAGELKEARESNSITEESRTRIENEIKVLMGEHEALVGDGFRITWKQRAGQKRIDYEAIARSLAERAGIGPHEFDQLVKAHEREGAPTRVFLPKWD